jgi:hypothetical protein
MARKKPSGRSEHSAFNVFYADGSQTSNRRIPKAQISPIDRDESIRLFFEAEDRAIETRSGRKRAPIKSIEPSRIH